MTSSTICPYSGSQSSVVGVAAVIPYSCVSTAFCFRAHTCVCKEQTELLVVSLLHNQIIPPKKSTMPWKLCTPRQHFPRLRPAPLSNGWHAIMHSSRAVELHRLPQICLCNENNWEIVLPLFLEYWLTILSTGEHYDPVQLFCSIIPLLWVLLTAKLW